MYTHTYAMSISGRGKRICIGFMVKRATEYSRNKQNTTLASFAYLIQNLNWIFRCWKLKIQEYQSTIRLQNTVRLYHICWNCTPCGQGIWYTTGKRNKYACTVELTIWKGKGQMRNMWNASLPHSVSCNIYSCVYGAQLNSYISTWLRWLKPTRKNQSKFLASTKSWTVFCGRYELMNRRTENRRDSMSDVLVVEKLSNEGNSGWIRQTWMKKKANERLCVRIGQVSELRLEGQI